MATASPELPGQLSALKQELLDARERARRLCQGLSEPAWSARPAPGQWAIAECLEHLNLTSERYLPIIDEALASAPPLSGRAAFGKGLMGGMLARMLEPPYKMRVKTGAAFVPAKVAPMAETLARFDSFQLELQARLDRSAGLDLQRVKVPSPFARGVKYNLFATFCIVTAHQRRHLWQAEQVHARVVPGGAQRRGA